MGFSEQCDQCLNGSMSTGNWVNRLAEHYLHGPEYDDRDVLLQDCMDTFYKYRKKSTAIITFFNCIW